MSASREHRNLGMLEDAVTMVGTAITVLEQHYTLLAPFLPDDAPPISDELSQLRAAHVAVQDKLGI